VNSVVSPKLLAFFFFGSLGVAFLLIPKDTELYGRLMADGHEKQAMEVLGEGQASATLIEQHLGRMATNTLGEGDPRRSAELCDEFIASGEESDEQILKTMMLAYRYTNRPADSLMAANKLAELLEKITGEVDEELAMERAQTYMALSQPGDAFDIYKNLFEKTRNSSNVNKLLPLLIQSASFSGKADELRPIYEHILSETPETKMSIAELIASRRAGNVDQHAKFMRSAGQFAQMCEWSNAYDTAFDYYLKLGALGDTAVLARLKDLNAGLFRDNEFGEVLESLVPLEGNDEYTLILARILGEDGQYEKSLEHFTQYSEKYPSEVEVVIQMGGLYEETGEMGKALVMYEKALEGRPSDPSILLRMAEINVAEGNYERALQSYKAFPETKHSEETVEEYAMLASALGDYDSYRNAMQITFTTTTHPTLEHYLDLAESHHLLGDSEAEMTVLNGAVHAFEGSPRAAVALAEAFYREGAHLEAAERLATLNLGENMQAAALFIEICNGTDDYQLAVKNLPDAIEERFDFTPSLRIALAQIYEGTGRNTQADRLYASVPSGNPAWQLVALSRYRMGDYDRAELYQKRFLRGAEVAGADDWTLMGDIYKTQGKDDLATQAYQKSLTLMKSGIAPITDSSS
jgi:tetratricopeptide (TPR) repeat protein